VHDADARAVSRRFHHGARPNDVTHPSLPVPQPDRDAGSLTPDEVQRELLLELRRVRRALEEIADR
jgi:hypothetical protein